MTGPDPSAAPPTEPPTEPPAKPPSEPRDGPAKPPAQPIDGDPRDAVERQLDAYNARDAEAFAACYSNGVVVEGADGTVTMRGRDELRDAYRSFFAANPELHAEVVSRIRIGRHVIDEELLTGRPAGDLRAVAVYHLDDDDLIDHVRFLV